MLLKGVALALVTTMAHAAPASALPPGVDQLPPIPELPDPFKFNDGSRVKSKADWEKRRAEIKELVLAYEYGHSAPPPGNVTAMELSSKEDETLHATVKQVLLAMGPDHKVSTHLELTIPSGKGPFPVIVKGDMVPKWDKIPAESLAEMVKRGYVFAQFDRTEIAPDDNTRDKGVYAAYGDQYDWGALSAWAWGFGRVVDYLVTQDFIDKARIIATGHSRGGKAALLAGALDERVALTVPNGSGAGGAGCYRVNPPKTENLKDIVTRFPFWFTPNFNQFIDHVDQLPIDQHDVRALVAPRALLTTDAHGDVWANAPGTQETYLASKEVFDFLGAGDKIGLHYREGKHEQNAEDFTALLDFADHLFAGKPAAQKFDVLPVPDSSKHFSWTAPKAEK
ncbi:MAG: hypothetical protein JWN24_1130 [Phycisphaerales bacterium]|nr:hypothetical protein [Phycisphaerales bacterium]